MQRNKERENSRVFSLCGGDTCLPGWCTFVGRFRALSLQSLRTLTRQKATSAASSTQAAGAASPTARKGSSKQRQTNAGDGAESAPRLGHPLGRLGPRVPMLVDRQRVPMAQAFLAARGTAVCTLARSARLRAAPALECPTQSLSLSATETVAGTATAVPLRDTSNKSLTWSCKATFLLAMERTTGALRDAAANLGNSPYQLAVTGRGP